MARLTDKERAKLDAKQLDRETCYTIMDQLVLDEFDWQDWFTDKPSKEYLNAFFNEIEYRDQVCQ